MFLDAWRANLSSDLHGAIFMNFIRLYAHIAWTTAQPLDLMEENCLWMCSNMPSPNDSRRQNWKATLHCTRLINFIYGNKPKTAETWLRMRSWCDEWEEDRPDYVGPIFQQNLNEGNPFPQVLFATDNHGGFQMRFYVVAHSAG